MAKIIDLRTYLLLERAFVRRLQRSWQQRSAPIYAAIAQACNGHKWDEARRLVPDLDMAEVGTENREWITYMLLSFAVFGASTVRKGKPTFVGVGTFDNFLRQVTNNMLQYLELGATSQIQAEALQLIAEDEAKTKALGLKFDVDQPRGDDGRWIREVGSPDTPTSTDKTAIGLIHNGVVRVKDLNRRDPYEVGHEDYWRTEVPASSRFRYNKGNIEWLDKPNPDEYFAVDDHFADRGWIIKGHYGQTYGDFIPPPAPSLKREYVRQPAGSPGSTGGEFAPKEGMRLATPEDAPRLKALKVPPAWKKVQVAVGSQDSLQAVGIDVKGKRQYKYTPKHDKRVAAEKFERVRDFVMALPMLREAIERDLDSPNPKIREAATALYLIDKSGFRIGSNAETKGDVKAYGTTTLLGRHVRVLSNGRVKFKFVGKSGVVNEKTIKDDRLASIMAERKKGLNTPLFKTTDQAMRNYMESIAPGFHPKDFRTHQGTAVALIEVKKRKAVKSEKEFKKVQKEIATVVAKHLGNTPAVAIKSYIDPSVWDRLRVKLDN